MAGVARPMIRSRPADGRRFIAGLGFGYLTGLTIISMAILTIAAGVDAAIPREPREVVLTALLLLMLCTDVLNRTLFVNRQVPQRFARQLAPGVRGLIWGTDLGLLISTQKTSSGLWAAIAIGILGPWPSLTLPVMLSGGAVYVLGVTVMSLTGADIVGFEFGKVARPILRTAIACVLAGASMVVLVS